MMNQEPYATSTIAMTIYNMATRLGRSFEGPWELADQLRTLFHADASDEIIARGFDELVARRLLIEGESGYRPVDTKNRPVCWRDITDVEIAPETGEVLGGWDGWQVRDPSRGAVGIEEVL